MNNYALMNNMKIFWKIIKVVFRHYIRESTCAWMITTKVTSISTASITSCLGRERRGTSSVALLSSKYIIIGQYTLLYQLIPLQDMVPLKVVVLRATATHGDL